MRPSTIFSMTFSGLPVCAACLREEFAAPCRADRAARRRGRSRPGSGPPPRRASRDPSRAPQRRRRAPSSRARPARRACRPRARSRPRDRRGAASCSTRFSRMFSPSLLIAVAIASAPFAPATFDASTASGEEAFAAIAAFASELREASGSRRRLARRSRSRSRARRAPPRRPPIAIATVPSLVSLPSRFAAFARPRSRSSVTACRLRRRSLR